MAKATLIGGWLVGVPELDPTLDAMVTLGTLPELAVERDLAGMWWAGAHENGWGLHIAQQGERLYAVLLVYDGAGRTVWFALEGGSWDPSRSVFSGELRDAAGTRVGTARLSFAAGGEGLLEYSIGGAAGSKRLERMQFGSTAPGTRRGTWRAPSGTLLVDQQGDTLFAAWATRDAVGNSTWYVMSGGSWISADTYAGTLYRTHGSPWVASPYDASRLTVTPAGKLTLSFGEGDAPRVNLSIEGRDELPALVRLRY